MDDEYLAFCLDQAIGILGQGITNELNSLGNDKKTKQREAQLGRKIDRRLSELLGLPEQASEKKYRTPTIG